MIVEDEKSVVVVMLRNALLVLVIFALVFAVFLWSEFRQIDTRIVENGPPAYGQLIAVNVQHMRIRTREMDGLKISDEQGNAKIETVKQGQTQPAGLTEFGFEQVVGRLWIKHPDMSDFSGYGFAVSKRTPFNGFNENVGASSFGHLPKPPFDMEAAEASAADVEQCDSGPERHWSWQFWSFITLAGNTSRCILRANTGFNFPVVLTMIHWQNYLPSPKLRRTVCEELVDPTWAADKAEFGACIFVDEFWPHLGKYPAQAVWFKIDDQGVAFLGKREMITDTSVSTSMSTMPRF